MGIAELGVMIPIIAVTLGLLCAMLSVIANHRRRLHELEFRHRERMAAIEKGMELPPDPGAPNHVETYYSERRTASPGSRYLLRGLVWLGIGFALVMPGYRFDHDYWSFGWIAVAVGGAYLIYYFVEGRHLGPARSDGDRPKNGTSQ